MTATASRSYRALVAEDDGPVRRAMRCVLDAMDLEVVEAPTRRSAQLTSGSFNGLVLHPTMREADAFVVLASGRTEQSGTPVVIVTTSGAMPITCERCAPGRPIS
jgi:DNA-binding NtrC family response regulator